MFKIVVVGTILVAANANHHRHPIS